MEPLRMVFFGTANLAVSSLSRLAQHNGFEISAVVSQPDRPKGRDLRVQSSPVKVEALRHNYTILQPEHCREASFITVLSELRPDLIVVAAYGQILPKSILELPKHGCLNVHASLLPQYRGAAPIQWAILSGDRESGVTIMKMDAGMDTGEILTQESTPINAIDTAASLHDRLAQMGAELLVRTIPDVVAGRVTGRKQNDSEASYARKISKQDGRMDWRKPAIELWNQVRALTPWPGTFTELHRSGEKTLVKIRHVEVVLDRCGAPGELLQAPRGEIIAACGTQAVRVLSLQLEGGRAMTAPQFTTGHSLPEGSRFV
ncbi:MAG: methionyl-tRNA formyltransferase [Verrucomicrobia bacterium]|nr:methionyl-tRNA formyltransferase [Verrucomicrobiota bacterium]